MNWLRARADILRDLGVPAAIGLGQLLLWALMLIGASPSSLGRPRDQVIAVTTAVVVVVLLCWRRKAPLHVLVAVLLVVGAARFLVELDDWALLGFPATVVALYSVAVRCPVRTTILAVAGAIAGMEIPDWFGPGGDELPTQLATVVLDALCCVAIAALGRARSRWQQTREMVIRTLAAAAEAQRRAAAEERHRLGRELHDVTAHHLTSIVVSATAAKRVAEQHPGLVREAVTFAAKAGRDTLAGLHRLVAVTAGVDPPPGPPLRERLDTLSDGFVQVGLGVTVTGNGPEPSADVAEACVAIAREALTNALRYASGASVAIDLATSAGTLTLAVKDSGGTATAPPVVGGGGRGLVGMRERAELLGGTLTAGPDGSGWQVCVTLPTGADPATLAIGAGHGLSDQLVLDVAVAVVAVGFPAMMATVTSYAHGIAQLGGLGARSVLVAGLVLHGLPLLWRRRAPWTVFALVTVTMAYCPAAAELGLLPAVASRFMLFTLGVHAIVAYSMGAYARPTWASWIAAPVLGLASAAATVGTAAVDGRLIEQNASLSVFVVTAVTGAMMETVTLVAFWLVGLYIKHRRERVEAREQAALARRRAETALLAAAERRRIADGLQASVLEQTLLLLETAEGAAAAPADSEQSQQLESIVGYARAALAGMRELLATLHVRPPRSAAESQPGANDIGALCAKYGTHRSITLRTDGVPIALPRHVDVSAYHLVDAALGAGDTQPATVRLDYRDETLLVEIGGVPSATTGVVRARLNARTAGIGGTAVTVDAATVMMSLPGGAADRWDWQYRDLATAD